MWAEMSSGPLALALSSEHDSSTTSFTSHERSESTDQGPQGTFQDPVCLVLNALD